jgi:hypothetical protein
MLGYRFTFGDAQAGRWSYSHRPRNEQIGGPLAAHVFHTPGTYEVQVRVKDSAGATSAASVTIRVESATSAFPGKRTVCISRTSDFDGCPSGARRLGNITSWPRFQPNSRYLLRRGHDFTSLGRINFQASGGKGISNAVLAAFGLGEKPRTDLVYLETGSAGPPSWPRRVVVMDLDAVGIVQTSGGFHLLFLRNDITRGGMIELASAFDYWLTHSSGSWRNPENIFLVENRIDRNFSFSGNPNGITGNGTRIAIMGNLVDRTAQHNLRLWQAHQAFVGHNYLTGRIADPTRHALKIHSAGLDPASRTLVAGVPQRQRTSELVIADNLLGSRNSTVNWLAVTAPQNDVSAEGLEKVILENNVFRYGANFAREITWAGRNVVERGNRNATSGGHADSGVGHDAALPADWRGPYYQRRPSVKSWF